MGLTFDIFLFWALTPFQALRRVLMIWSDGCNYFYWIFRTLRSRLTPCSGFNRKIPKCQITIVKTLHMIYFKHLKLCDLTLISKIFWPNFNISPIATQFQYFKHVKLCLPAEQQRPSLVASFPETSPRPL